MKWREHARNTDLTVRYMGLTAKSGKVCTLIIIRRNIPYRITLMNPEKEIQMHKHRTPCCCYSLAVNAPSTSSTCSRKTALFSKGCSLWMSMVCSTYLTNTCTAIVSRIAY